MELLQRFYDPSEGSITLNGTDIRALDADSEHRVQQALEVPMNNRTTIIIAHRLATILHADSIAAL